MITKRVAIHVGVAHGHVFVIVDDGEEHQVLGGLKAEEARSIANHLIRAASDLELAHDPSIERVH